jgi:hypothetical protein
MREMSQQPPYRGSSDGWSVEETLRLERPPPTDWPTAPPEIEPAAASDRQADVAPVAEGAGSGLGWIVASVAVSGLLLLAGLGFLFLKQILGFAGQ